MKIDSWVRRMEFEKPDSQMGDIFTKEKRSQVMSLIRSKGNRSTEIAFMRLLQDHKITGWRRNSKLFGKPDFIFPKAKIAIFIDGDFWHWNPKRPLPPSTNTEYWAAKLERNQRRDRHVTRELKAKGWAVIRIWESTLARYPGATIARVSGILRKRQPEPRAR